MKETTKASVAGIVFMFDSEAHQTIKEYLDKLRKGYADNPDGKEIIADIEARIAELILLAQSADKTVENPLAESIVSQLGFPDGIGSGETPGGRFQRRLYRNAEGQRLGGVCSGLGTYFNIDPSLIRIGIFLPLLFGILFRHGMWLWGGAGLFFKNLFGCILLLYIVMWIAIPMARSPREKLEMKGEKITAKSIKEIKESDSSATERNDSVWNEVFCCIGRVLLFCIKAVILLVGVLVGLVAMCVLVSIILALSGGLLNEDMLRALSTIEPVSPRVYMLLLLASILLFMAIAFCVIVRLLGTRRRSHTPLVVMAILWLLVTVSFSVITIKNFDRMDIDAILEAVENVGYHNDITVSGSIEDEAVDDDDFDKQMESLGTWTETSADGNDGTADAATDVFSTEISAKGQVTESVDSTSGKKVKSLKVEVSTE